MTMPLERTRSLLWAGGLLVSLNGDRRVPLEYRRAATAIARHFPTVEDVSSASHLRLFGRDGGMFEHPQECEGWEESCPGPPLTYNTRLNWPSADVDDGIDEDVGTLDGDVVNELDAREQLEESLDAVALAQEALRQHKARAARTCLQLQPKLKESLQTLGLDQQQIDDWVLRPQFDDNTKSVSHLLIEEREREINERLQQATQEHRMSRHPTG